MLDTDTKRRIDTARDILVGKVPDPKSQVEQITIALIYKFMDDMDAEAEEFGGRRRFFAGDFARYGWARLMRGGLGGHEMLGLYAEAIARMPENPGIPPLFRDIFKNAFLPYRDPETLRAFLKVIDEFTYDHSERLGDAFEYLLSVLGSQGDAGQFRTPRHIIDFIVAIVDPKKTDTVLDPACGTAGFLISAYKHILRANSGMATEGTGNTGNDLVDSVPPVANLLTPDERARLAASFKGYDISPDMVRLSLVNLYLHGFTDPHVFEYDTLTSQERWHEYADVILANPPFMSPKGGIKPHNRFGVQSKRSEVLFVDYMAEHLTPNGRAGIIVPEGIIFQSQGAYVQLRKMLVEDALVAVVSLPAGVFQPYSGVKTSILILDKALARHSDHVAFFKIENDGFNLGAQRRPIDKNDLPQAAAEIGEYLRRLRARETVEPAPVESGQGEGFRPTLGLVVPKERIAANGDYNLSGERYREGAISATTHRLIPVQQLMKDSVKTVDPRISPDELFELWSIPAFDAGQPEVLRGSEIGSQKKVVFPGDVLLSRIIPHIRRSWVVRENRDSRRQIASTEWIVFAGEQVIPEYLQKVLVSDRFHAAFMQTVTGVGGSLSRANPGAVGQIEIPLPPLEVQQEIVAEIEGYQKVIDGARAVLDHYRPHIPIHPDWPMVAISEVASVESGFGFPLDHQGESGEEIPFLKVSDMNLPGNEVRISSWNNSISKVTLATLKARSFPKGTVIFPKIGAAIATNKKRLLTTQSTFDNNVMGIVPYPEKLIPEFLYIWLLGFDLSTWASEAQPPSMRKTVVEAYPIPCPPLETQRAIVAEIEAEQALVNANRELIARMERKIAATLARVWGDAEPQDADAPPAAIPAPDAAPLLRAAEPAPPDYSPA